MNRYLSDDAAVPSYVILPRCLLSRDLGAAELCVYMLLLDRARLSCRSGRWRDKEGRVFLYYPVRDLAKKLGRSETAVKRALARLESMDLISRQRQGLGKPNRIFVKVPEAELRACPPKESADDLDRAYRRLFPEAAEEESPEPEEAPSGCEKDPSEGHGVCLPEGRGPDSPEGQETVPQKDRYLPPNKNYGVKTKREKMNEQAWGRKTPPEELSGFFPGAGDGLPLTPPRPGQSPGPPPSCR